MKDRISSLPDEVLSHILSFFPTKFAATTSILSKRWNSLWLSVPTLKVDDGTFQNIESFLKFVSSALLSRDTAFPIQSFHLKCTNASKRRHSLDINSFFDALAQRRIQNVTLDLTTRANVPPSLFSCRTLVVLRLRNIRVNHLSKLDVDFPHLRTLHLSFIMFERIDYLVVLLYGCPILQELLTRCLGVGNHKIVYNWREPPYIPECLSTQLKTCSIKQFTLTDYGYQFAEYILKNSKVLETMSIKKSASFGNKNVKSPMLTKLASEERASPTCKFLFD